MSNKESILKSLEPLFSQAEKEGLWFRSNYQHIELSPKELKVEHANGRFIWGFSNWNLFDPKTLLKDPDEEYRKAVLFNNKITERMKR